MEAPIVFFVGWVEFSETHRRAAREGSERLPEGHPAAALAASLLKFLSFIVFFCADSCDNCKRSETPLDRNPPSDQDKLLFGAR